jgi:hypothetical protein
MLPKVIERANMFQNLANRIEDNEVDVHDGEYVMLCSNTVLQDLTGIELWQNTQHPLRLHIEYHLLL